MEGAELWRQRQDLFFVCYAAAAAEKEINKWMLTVTLTYASAINPVLLNYHCRPDNKRRKYSFFRLTL